MAESEHLRMAAQAERDLNSYQAKQGLGPKSDSSTIHHVTILSLEHES